jgi:hypothetical protein
MCNAGMHNLARLSTKQAELELKKSPSADLCRIRGSSPPFSRISQSDALRSASSSPLRQCKEFSKQNIENSAVESGYPSPLGKTAHWRFDLHYALDPEGQVSPSSSYSSTRGECQNLIQPEKHLRESRFR